MKSSDLNGQPLRRTKHLLFIFPTLVVALLLAATPSQLRYLECRIPAAFGSVESKLELGRMYAEGDLVAADANEAYNWYSQAAASGDPRGMFRVGVALLTGAGVPADAPAAARWFEKAANMGLAEARYNLGLMHEYGMGVEEDHQKAASLYMLSADDGLPRAQWALGRSYDLGVGLSLNRAMSAYWFRRAAENGDVLGMAAIGRAHCATDGGTEKDYRDALHWFQKAVNEGYVEANYALAAMYYEGHGVPKDDHVSLSYARKAAQGDDHLARCLLGRLHGGNLVAVVKDEFKSHQFYLEAAMNGCEESPYRLALIYERGAGAARDLVEAYAWHNVASFLSNSKKVQAEEARERLAEVLTADARFKAEQRSTELRRTIKSNTDAARIRRFHARALKTLHVPRVEPLDLKLAVRKAETDPVAQVDLADGLMAGKDYPRNSNMAYAMYESAHKKGYLRASMALARCHLQGRGVPRSVSQAVEILEVLANDKSDMDAQVLLGWIYSADGPYEDLQKSMHWYQAAANQGHPEALYQLGCIYQTAVIVTQDNALAVDLWDKAASKGHLKASWDLGVWYFFGAFVKQDKTKGAELLKAPEAAGMHEYLLDQAGLRAYKATSVEDRIEAYAWANVASMSGAEKARVLRDRVASSLDAYHIALGQSRSAKLAAEIQERRNQFLAR